MILKIENRLRNSKGMFINENQLKTVFCKKCNSPMQTLVSNIEKGKGKYCSKICMNSDYKRYKRGKDHPNFNPDANTKFLNGKQIPIYRLIAEEKIGRPLQEGEIVHHINGDRKDNRPKNLFVCMDKYHRQLHYQLNPKPYLDALKRGNKTRCQSKIIVKPKNKAITDKED